MPSFSNSFCRAAVSATVVGQKVLVGRPTRIVSARDAAGGARSAAAVSTAAASWREICIMFVSSILLLVMGEPCSRYFTTTSARAARLGELGRGELDGPHCGREMLSQRGHCGIRIAPAHG